MQINEKKVGLLEIKYIEHFLSIPKSVTGVTNVSCVISETLEIRTFPHFFHIICLGNLTFHKTIRNRRLIYSYQEKIP